MMTNCLQLAPRQKHIDLPDLELMHYEGFSAKEEADLYYTTLLQNTPWREYQMPMYDKIVTSPRLVAWCGTRQEAGAILCLGHANF
jgi:hypothetical protein